LEPKVRNGAAHLCAILEAHGVKHVFGVPGSQDLALYEALRASRIRSVLTTNELAAGFMANGYYRASGRIAPLLTIPGPGFTWALTPVAEALQDSVALVHLVGRPPGSDHRLHLQAIDQRAVAAPLVKGTFCIDEPSRIESELGKAIRLALEGEPGPVLVELTPHALESAAASAARGAPAPQHAAGGADVGDVVASLLRAKHPVLLVGQGAIGAASLVRELAELLGAPVFSTASGRGVLPEDHALALVFDGERGNAAVMNQLVASSDLVLVLGCKLGFSGSLGFTLKLPLERVVRVDTSEDALRVTYPAKTAFVASVEAFLGRVVPEIASCRGRHASTWKKDEIARWARRLREPTVDVPEPFVQGAETGRLADFFSALRSALPRDGIVCADSGLHQQLLRRHFDVLAPRGLLFPSDYQSMGFGLPAAIGAKLAAPERPVVAVLGDGGFAMSGLELLTAVREDISLTVIVFNDGQLGRIRLSQLAASGRTNSVELSNPDFEAFASAVGASYACLNADAERILRASVERPGVKLLELRLGDSAGVHALRARGLARGAARKMLSPGILRRLKGGLTRPKALAHWPGHPRLRTK
jgi:acetolactate synthase-1/2/3 large subunit